MNQARRPDLANWTREDMETLVPELRASISRRQADIHDENFGWDYGHRDRLGDEGALLRLIENVLNGGT
jgi:hypothetical protein